MTEQVILIAIGILVAGFVLRPLWRGRVRPASKQASMAAPTSAGRPDELSELELDREMGRVSEEDYQKWRAEMERVPAGTVIDMQVESEEELARAEALIRRWVNEPRPVCPRCGVRPEPAARFCSNCGQSLSS